MIPTMIPPPPPPSDAAYVGPPPVGLPMDPPPPLAPPRLPGRRRHRIGLAALVAVSVAGGGVAGWLGGRSQRSEAPAQTAAPPLAVSPAGAQDVTGLVAAALPSVVSISVQLPGGSGEGSGFLISPDGAIVTNAHVVADATAVSVTLHDGSEHEATIVGVDRTDDLAVIDIDGSGLAALTLGESTGLAVGTPVVAIGNALGLTGGPTATTGIVSGVDRSIDTDNGEHLSHLLQTDAAINPGNSGGPLLTLDGRVVGVNSAGATDAQNVGFAIGISNARTIIDQLEQGKTVSRPFLGVSTIVVGAAVARRQGLAVDHGLLVTEIVAGSGAEAAGMRSGDVIVSAGGTAIDDETALRDAIVAAGAGNPLALVVNRDGKEIGVTATLGSQPA